MSDPTHENLNGSMPEGADVWAKYRDIKNLLNETGTEAKNLEGPLKSLSSVARVAGPQFSEMAELITSRMGPIGAIATAAAMGMQTVFEHIQKLQDQFHSLIDDAQRVNDRIRGLINDQPSKTESQIQTTDQTAQLHEHADRSWVQEDQFIAAKKEADQIKVDDAPENQKPALKRQVITDEIAETKAALERDAAKGTDVDAAQSKINQTHQTEEHLKKQIRELPGIIATLKENAAKANATAKSTWWPGLSGDEFLLGQDQTRQAARMQEQLDKANAQFPGAATAAADAENELKNVQQNNERIQELKEQIIKLGNRLGAFDNSKDGKTFQQQVQGIIDQNQGTGHSIREMADKLHYSQQQLMNLATGIITQHGTVQSQIAYLQKQLEEQSRQIAAMPHSTR